MAGITKIQLNDGSVYAIFDTGSLHLNEDGVLITGNTMVDEIILCGTLKVTAINDVPLNQYISNVLVQDTATGEIKKRSTNVLLKDIGGTSYSVNGATLSLKVGK